MKELQDIVNARVAEMIADGPVKEKIESGVQKAIDKAIEAQFETWGNVTKQLEKAMQEGLQINVGELPFETYNQQMLVAVKARLGNLFQGQASEQFMQQLDKMLEPAPSEMPLTTFVETVAAFWKTEEPWDADELDEYATVELDSKDSSTMDCRTLKMWKQKEHQSYLSGSHQNQPDLQIYLIDGKIRISHGQSYNPTCFSEHEAFVFKLYAAGTVLNGLDEFDPDECELILKETDY